MSLRTPSTLSRTKAKSIFTILPRLVREIESKLRYQNRGDREHMGNDRYCSKKAEIFKILFENSSNNNYNKQALEIKSNKLYKIMTSNTVESDSNSLSLNSKNKFNSTEEEQVRELKLDNYNVNKINTIKSKFDKMITNRIELKHKIK
jgi:hypothetical protein